ncbi:hypothetical protein BV22DRAFT_1194677 [Leucogyrophana mollusca]|uniref:Uncharacterized protein n=1 Tax=Leucogyrophana mollusca TaxID=85980 RepID=A0ACB8BLD5_9AGAM|nr:hypothetical protein BV22DRAFT_1194677 [Leucogyrophana mollusca]
MSDRPSTASSEKSIYFDAPVMHFFSSNERNRNANDNDNANASRREQERDQDSGAFSHSAVANHQPGVDDSAEAINGEPNGSASNGPKSQRLSRSYLPPQQNVNQPARSSMSPDGRPLNGPPSVDGSNLEKPQRAQGERRTPSLRSLPESAGGGIDSAASNAGGGVGGGSTLSKKASVRTARSNRTAGTTAGATAAFGNGAALTGPNAEPDVDDTVLYRGATAERSLSKKQRDRIVKDEQKESKRFSKLLKTESTAEKAALSSALNTLASLQALHKAAIKRESKAEAAHAKALAAAQKAESRFHEEKARAAEERARAEARVAEERARWEGREAEVRAQQERVDSERGTVKEMEERVAECAREVERLRIVKGTDERERQAKMVELTGRQP